MWVVCLAGSLMASAAAPDAKILDQVRFENSGTVTRETVFKKITRDAFYVETDNEYFRTRNYPYTYEIKDGKPVDPPSGVRSSVPLGGLGAGTVELRADGRFMDWNIFNNTPSNDAGKDQFLKTQLDQAVMGLWTRQDGRRNAKVLRTDAPLDLPSVEQIDYSGAFPVSRIRFSDSKIPLETMLYAWSEFKLRDAERSATPCALFSLELHNPTDKPVEAGFLFSLPNHIGGTISADDKLTFARTGSSPMNGDMTLMAEGADRVSFMAGDDLRSIWSAFSNKGEFPKNLMKADGGHGAISASATIAPGQTRVVTIAMAWYFPNRLFFADPIGNYYTKLFKSSADVATTALGRMDESWTNILEWNRSCFDNSLPDWLQDGLVNSAGTIFKTSLWTEDGRFRQYESFSCWDIEAIHIHFARALPYELFFPELKENLFELFAKLQREDGYIHEQYPDRSGKHFDQAGGRNNGDSCTLFILGVYMSYHWRNAPEFTDAMWPHVKQAAQWQIQRAKEYGLPNNLVSTYDLSGFESKNLVSYNGFLHLAAMQAAAALADAKGDKAFADECRQSFDTGQEVLMKNLWNGEHFRCWWNKEGPLENKLHVDSLYGQLWGYLLGLDDIVPRDALLSHLQAEVRYADSPYGLQVILDPAKKRPGPPDVSDFLNTGSVDDLGKYNHKNLNQTVWQVGSINWTTMNLFLGNEVDDSLSQAKKLINHWRLTLNDQWDYRDLSALWDGHPYCNSHYGRQLMFWAIPMALSGQEYSAVERRLSFAPRTAAPYRLPFYTPQANGVLVAGADGEMQLEVFAGTLDLKSLTVFGKLMAQDISLKSGGSIMLEVK